MTMTPTLAPSPSPTFTPSTDTEQEFEEPDSSHIVRREGMVEAYIVGTPIEALCGNVFTLSRV